MEEFIFLMDTTLPFSIRISEGSEYSCFPGRIYFTGFKIIDSEEIDDAIKSKNVNKETTRFK
ncbi:hypothetical protein LEP1GSC116_0017 [Leptospira interrogans serovar Icterohaemorrhagiae str. Verdun HP]|uniref:Uncharacterized protein n=2 Tax=Leptospira interrogans TaxID=173 RepID=M6R2T4_LEPIR|nr:hypothetical protein LEP1GSC116_0017 [Leptospira interrogans serovar Icterohaemorrhagiae str. Verdun HP]